MTDVSGPTSWPTLAEGTVEQRGVFGVQQVTRRSPRTGHAAVYQVLHMPDWVNVIALTPEQEIVLVVQYRHGVDTIAVEIPGGAVEAGEDPAVAAVRELREETGFVGDPPIALGSVQPNPALQTNACSTWLVPNARQVHALALDDGEDIEVTLVPRAEIDDWVADGRIDHALVVAAFYWWRCYDFAMSGA